MPWRRRSPPVRSSQDRRPPRRRLEPGGCIPVHRGLKTISGGIIREDAIISAGADLFLSLIFAGLIGAITWNMLTWLLGLPSSSSHAAVRRPDRRDPGRCAGSAASTSAWCSRRSCSLRSSPPSPRGSSPSRRRRSPTRSRDVMTASPTVADGFPLGADLHVLAGRTRARHQRRAEDDGVITLALITIGWQSGVHHEPQLWVIVACAFTIALGTYLGGWRIIRTLWQGAHRCEARAGLRGGELDGSDDPGLQRARLRALDHAGGLGLRDRLRPRSPRLHGPLADGGSYRRRLAAHASPQREP